jgi:hypothetical protein
MEPERPKVDRTVLDFGKGTIFEPADFTSRSVGVVRLHPQLARDVGRIVLLLSQKVWFEPAGLDVSSNDEAS